jgi:hypothetical protein
MKLSVVYIIDVSLAVDGLPILETPSHSAWPWKMKATIGQAIEGILVVEDT